MQKRTQKTVTEVAALEMEHTNHQYRTGAESGL